MHDLGSLFLAKLVLIKASSSYELLPSGEAQTCYLDNTFILTV